MADPDQYTKPRRILANSADNRRAGNGAAPSPLYAIVGILAMVAAGSNFLADDEPSMATAHASANSEVQPVRDTVADDSPGSDARRRISSQMVASSDLDDPVDVTIGSRTAPQQNLFHILASLQVIDPATLTAVQVRRIVRDLEHLVALEGDAIPAIQHFLAGGKDLDFEAAGASPSIIKHPTLRVALYDVLRRIGGADAECVLRGELQISSSPLEIEAAAGALEQLAPDRYRPDVVAAALGALALARDADRNPADVRPLFKLIKQYGDETVVSDLENYRGRWQTYAIATLAEIADGHGIPALIGLAESPPTHSTNVLSERSLFALQMLTQAAPGDLRAADALVGQAQSGRIPENLWPRIALTLTGDYLFQLDGIGEAGSIPVPIGTRDDEPSQTIYLKRGGLAGLSVEDREARIAMVDRLLEFSGEDPATRALLNARELLTQEGP